VGVLGLVTLWPRSGRATDAPTTAAQCEAAYEGTQLMRQRGKLLAARDQADVCARDACPDVARNDCARWSGELAKLVPSVVVVAREPSGRDVPGSRLLVDGTVRPELASGRAFELDPGTHLFRVERAAGPAVEQTFTVVQGERDRLLRLTLPPSSVPHPAPAPPSPSSEAPSSAGSLVPAAVAGGIAVVLLGTSAYLGLTGRQELSDLRSSGCAPDCTGSQVDPIRSRLTASDWTLGVGLVGAAVAVSLFAFRGSF
jgi:hypothetical protein